MIALIKTKRPITEAEIQEVKELLDVQFTIEHTDEAITPTWNPFFKVIEIDWKWFKSLFGRRKFDIYCFCTTQEDLEKNFITDYIGLYNLDRDNVHDFWIGVPEKLYNRAKHNGFRSNFAWLFIHEYLHGKLHFNKEIDSVHEMEKQGRLKELLNRPTPPTREQKEEYLGLLQWAVALLKQLVGRKYTKPLPNHWHLVTQKYLNYDPLTYPKTGYHPGTDFAAPLNTPILAPADGEITRSGYSPSLGNWCEFKFDSYHLVALHLREKPVKGYRSQGEPIGFVGDTGLIDGIHAHLELWNRPMDRGLLTSREALEEHTLDVTELF